MMKEETFPAEASAINVTAGTLTFRLRVWGPPDAPPLLLLGHVPDVPFILDGLAAALAQTKTPCRVLVPERIDVGPDARFFAIADDLAQLIQALGAGRVDVVGVGFGGTVAVHLGATAPQLVRAVALIDSPLPNLHGVDTDLARRLGEAYGYVADFLDPKFTDNLAAGDDRPLRQFWERATWWPEQEARYREEFARPEFGARVAAAYRANYTLLDAGGPQRLVAPVLAPQPVLLEIPSLYYASCPQIQPP